MIGWPRPGPAAGLCDRLVGHAGGKYFKLVQSTLPAEPVPQCRGAGAAAFTVTVSGESLPVTVAAEAGPPSWLRPGHAGPGPASRFPPGWLTQVQPQLGPGGKALPLP